MSTVRDRRPFRNIKLKKKFIRSLAGCITAAGIVVSSLTGCTGSEKPLLTIDVFDAQANSQGIQEGWFGQAVKDRFNLELNIIAPNVSLNGDSLLNVRAAAGNIGDVIIINADRNALSDMVSQGLFTDISGYLKDKEIYKRYKNAIDTLNEGLDGIYAIPSSISTLDPSEPDVISEPTFMPYIRWDYYEELGCPEISSLEDYLPVFKAMQENHPTNENGDPV